MWQGYPTDEPCDICGKVYSDNMLEPRFYYSTCQKHAYIPPAYRHRVKKIFGSVAQSGEC